jgi:Dyp-type peroxidase family
MQLPAALSSTQGPMVPGAPAEPVLDTQEIQGNSLVGFNKDHQAFLFFQITETSTAKRWLQVIAPHVATIDETLAFRRLFRVMRSRRGQEVGGLVATWINVAFSSSGIEKLTSAAELDKFTSDAFKLGMASRAGLLGDETDAKGDPQGWIVGGPERVIDILLIVASDRVELMRAEVRRLKDQIGSMQGVSVALENQRGLWVVYEEEGCVLPGSLAGHEHFGFRDGISQPGIRGLVSSLPLDFLTPRLIDPQDPMAATYARPGQPLIWPGQFVLGSKYPLQNMYDPLLPQANTSPQPAWAENGSYIVLRRLKQDVSAFWRFMAQEAKALGAKYPLLGGLTAQRLATLIVGRWPSGAPLMREPLLDNPNLADHALAINNFQFTNAARQIMLSPAASNPPDTFPLSVADAEGLRCPFASHIRKVNPRDDTTELGGPERSLTRRILRRGIPFGRPLQDVLQSNGDNEERGLMFVAYQASIESQFEFLMTDWANSPVNPHSYVASVEEHPAGQDPIIGRQPVGGPPRGFTIRVDQQTFETAALPKEWVIPTGGGYFFVPSVTALKMVLAN